MSKVKLLVSMALAAATSGATAIGVSAVIVDATGASQTTNELATAFPAPSADGTFTVELDFDGVASGDFSGTVSAYAEDGSAVSAGVSYSGTCTNLQPLPVSVAIAFA